MTNNEVIERIEANNVKLRAEIAALKSLKAKLVTQKDERLVKVSLYQIVFVIALWVLFFLLIIFNPALEAKAATTLEAATAIGDQPATLYLITYEEPHYQLYQWLRPRAHLGVIMREHSDYFMAGADLLIGYDTPEPGVLLNLGLSQFAQKTERLGTKLNFHLTIEVRWQALNFPIFMKYSHWSNGGGTIIPAGSARNIGEDYLGVGFVF